MPRVVLAMSGGVDSSVAAHLLRERDYDVVGVFMRHGLTVGESCSTDLSPLPRLQVLGNARRDHKQGCCSAADAADARRVADMLGIPFYAINFEDEFGAIIDYFVKEYATGRTPNPCVMCNNWLKFGKLFEYADSVGAEFVATGHYARIENSETPAIHRGRDETKDQSYVLFGIDRRILPRLLFPVGGYQKSEIRAIARKICLRVADKQDSQEICFVTSGNHAEFVRTRRGACDTSGEFVDSDGTVLGHHGGIEQFTVGQRKGLGVALGDRRYVVRIDAESRQVTLGPREALARLSFTASQTNWLADPPAGRFECEVQVRYQGRRLPASVKTTGKDGLRVVLHQAPQAIAPGQAVVCYDGTRVLGGGWID
jgi:tRNA-specific 2-thiouridylase